MMKFYPEWVKSSSEITLRRWHIGLILIGLSLLGLFYVSWLALSVPQPVTTRELTLFLSVFGLPYFIWTLVIRPWVRLFDDRIVLAHDLLVH